MPNRARAALALIPFLAAAAINAATPAPGAALPKQGSGPGCDCWCNTGSGPSVERTYTNPVAACSAYNGKTCNFEGADGIIHTGTLVLCQNTNASPGHAGNLRFSPSGPAKNANPGGGSAGSSHPTTAAGAAAPANTAH